MNEENKKGKSKASSNEELKKIQDLVKKIISED